MYVIIVRQTILHVFIEIMNFYLIPFFLNKMPLNKDVLFLVFENLKNDIKSLYSCLLVNRTWCITAVPFLWKNPGRLPEKYLKVVNNSSKKLFNIILLHLPKESKDVLENQGIDNTIIETFHQCPLFN